MGGDDGEMQGENPRGWACGDEDLVGWQRLPAEPAEGKSRPVGSTAGRDEIESAQQSAVVGRMRLGGKGRVSEHLRR